jgi:Holliday junction resolvasome RuvABC endonuclease subunit
MVVVGLDLSVTNTGLAIVDLRGSQPKAAYLATVPTKKLGRNLTLKIRAVAMAVSDVVSQAVGMAGDARVIVAIEEGFLGTNVATATKLAMVRGAALGVVGILERDMGRQITIDMIPPSSWRKIALGAGNIAKESSAMGVARVLGLQYKPPTDAWDAAGVALAAGNVHRRAWVDTDG